MERLPTELHIQILDLVCARSWRDQLIIGRVCKLWRSILFTSPQFQQGRFHCWHFLDKTVDDSWPVDWSEEEFQSHIESVLRPPLNITDDRSKSYLHRFLENHGFIQLNCEAFDPNADRLNIKEIRLGTYFHGMWFQRYMTPSRNAYKRFIDKKGRKGFEETCFDHEEELPVQQPSLTKWIDYEFIFTDPIRKGIDPRIPFDITNSPVLDTDPFVYPGIRDPATLAKFNNRFVLDVDAGWFFPYGFRNSGQPWYLHLTSSFPQAGQLLSQKATMREVIDSIAVSLGTMGGWDDLVASGSAAHLNWKRNRPSPYEGRYKNLPFERFSIRIWPILPT